MRRYRRRTPLQETLIGNNDSSDATGAVPIDPPTLFGRDAPVRFEVGFGHGEFIRQLAATHPDEDHIGIEYNPLRVTKTAHKCVTAGLSNVKLFQGEAEAFVRDRMPEACCDRQYVLFSDPWPRKRHRRRRLINRAFLVAMTRAARPGCRLMIATDTHNYGMQALSCLSTLASHWRLLYPMGYKFDIPTRFTTVFQRHKKAEGHRICYVHAERTDAAAPDLPATPSTAINRMEGGRRVDSNSKSTGDAE